MIRNNVHNAVYNRNLLGLLVLISVHLSTQVMDSSEELGEVLDKLLEQSKPGSEIKVEVTRNDSKINNDSSIIYVKPRQSEVNANSTTDDNKSIRDNTKQSTIPSKYKVVKTSTTAKPNLQEHFVSKIEPYDDTNEVSKEEFIIEIEENIDEVGDESVNAVNSENLIQNRLRSGVPVNEEIGIGGISIEENFIPITMPTVPYHHNVEINNAEDVIDQLATGDRSIVKSSDKDTDESLVGGKETSQTTQFSYTPVIQKMGNQSVFEINAKKSKKSNQIALTAYPPLAPVTLEVENQNGLVNNAKLQAETERIMQEILLMKSLQQNVDNSDASRDTQPMNYLNENIKLSPTNDYYNKQYFNLQLQERSKPLSQPIYYQNPFITRNTMISQSGVPSNLQRNRLILRNILLQNDLTLRTRAQKLRRIEFLTGLINKMRSRFVYQPLYDK